MHLKLSALILLLLEIILIWYILVLLLIVSHQLTRLQTLQPITLVTIKHTLQGLTAGNQLAEIKEIVVFLNSASFMRKELASH